MPAINFPASPSVNDLFTSSGKTWKWNGTFWELVVSGASVADGSVSTAKIADGAITAAKIADGTIVAAEIANNAITTDKIATGAVTAAKLGNDISLTPADGSITQAKLAASLSGITVTTLAGRSAAVPSPFTGQTIFLSDVTRLQVWNGSAWTFITNGAPGAPTSLSATVLSTTSVSVAFTTGTINGASPTNYKYSLSTDGGSTYGEPTALDPADTTSPVTISGLTTGNTYHIKLRAVSDFGDSSDSTATSVLVAVAPDAPTSLSASGIINGATITFTPGASNGSAITNYQYALSTNGGSTYGSFTALNPADATSPITISGLTGGTTYTIKLKAVNAIGAGTESASVSTTVPVLTVDYLVVAGGGGGGSNPSTGRPGGGGGAGGLRSTVTASGGSPGTTETAFTLTVSTNYAVTVGAGGAAQNNGSNSVFNSITSIGGGSGGFPPSTNGGNGGSGGGGQGESSNNLGGSGTANQGFAGGNGVFPGGNRSAAGGGGAGAAAANASTNNATAGGAGVSTSITGSSVAYAGGGGGGSESTPGGAGGNGGGGAGNTSSGSGTAGTANRGGGGGGGGNTSPTTGGAGGSGVVILRYPEAYTITFGAGLTGTESAASGGYKRATVTAGSGNVSWT